MHKIIGAVLLLISAFLCSLYLISKEKKHVELLGGFNELIREIYKQIEMLNLPVPEILERADERFLTLCGIREGEAISLEKLIDLTENRLDPKEREIIMSFASGLGRCYRDEQLRLCKYYSGELESCLAARKNDYPKKRKLIITLTVCAALGIIILII
ncbi:MAG: stage III sporulation protein AB [Clostridia bacterium]|nr:stage III sporulation protein AB [Clostridia bacterium]